MAAVEVTISGVLYDKLNRTTQQVVLIGDASLTGLGVGGGPMPGGPPPWVSHPIPPVVWPNPPGGGAPVPPLGTWGGDAPWPGYATPPIYIPPLPPVEPPPDANRVVWKTAWTPTEGWTVVGIITPELPHPTPSS
jgi:hypothetical protein